MKVKVYNQSGQQTQEEVDLNSKIFELPKIKPDVVHFVANALLSNRRNTVASTKTRGEVRGGGRKPWQQKGTGRARHGSIRSPLWKGGGVTFGPKSNRNFKKKVNKKIRRLGIFSVLTDRAKDGRIIILDKLEVSGKTKEFSNTLKEMVRPLPPLNPPLIKGEKKEGVPGEESRLDEKTLIILPQKNGAVQRASGNLKNVRIALANNFNLLELLWADRVLILKDALGVIEKAYLKT